MLYLYCSVLAVAILIFAEEVYTGWVSRKILLVFNFRSFSPRSPRIKARLEAAKQAVADAYTARDVARRVGEKSSSYSLAERQLDATWKRLVHLGGAAFFCGAPMSSRKLQARGGRLRLELTLGLALITTMLFAVSTNPAGASHISSDCPYSAEQRSDSHPEWYEKEDGVLVITIFDWEAAKANRAYACMVKNAGEYYTLTPQSVKTTSNKTWRGWTPTTIIGTFKIKSKSR